VTTRIYVVVMGFPVVAVIVVVLGLALALVLVLALVPVLALVLVLVLVLVPAVLVRRWPLLAWRCCRAAEACACVCVGGWVCCCVCQVEVCLVEACWVWRGGVGWGRIRVYRYVDVCPCINGCACVSL
jgi:hypothetical protein